MTLGRHAFLRAAALFSAGLLTGCGSSSSPDIGNGPVDVLVVGAGISGQAAADYLRSNGRSVAILESRDRAGGRTFCDNTTFPEHPVDLGAQFFHQSADNVLLGRAEQLGFQTAPFDSPLIVADSFAGSVQTDDTLTLQVSLTALLLEEALVARGDLLQTNPAADLSLDALAAELGFVGPGYGLASRLAANIAEGRPGSAVSVLDVANAILRTRNAHDDRLNLGGMGNFVARLFPGLPISLNTAVHAIDWSRPDLVRLGTSQGTLEARKVIVTVPLGVLAAGRIRFDPVLPAEYLQAFARLPMGVVDKIFLSFSENIFGDLAPNTGVLTKPDDPNGPWLVVRLYGKNLCLCFVGHTLARELEAGGEAALVEFARAQIADVFGSNAAAKFVSGIATRWGTDPHSLGSYTSAVVGGVDSRRVLATPLDNRLFFAGEAASLRSHSSVLGAYEAGLASAAAAHSALT